jgi:outer membrane receptor protein involved in Fe transport
MKKLISLTAMQLCLCLFVWAQDSAGSVHGSVMDATHEPLPFANILLFNASDSTLAKAEYASEDGSFKMLNIEPGDYWLKASFVGLPDYISELLIVQANNTTKIPPVVLDQVGTELAEVVVTALKPLIEVKPDKTVFNVEGSINATGNTAFELMRKAPGLIVDNNDNIILLGKSGVKIFIDGRPSPLSADDLVEMLKSMQSDQIEAIEIITNPSSKYEAEGNAGIINIRMKKDKRHGTNANITLGYTIGVFPKYNGSTSVNHRNKKMNVFGSYSHSTGNRRNNFNLYREQLGMVYDQRNIRTADYMNHNFKAGADYLINDKNTIGLSVDGFISDRNDFNDGKTAISIANSNVVDSLLVATSRNSSETSNLDYNLNYRYDGGTGLIWNFDANFGQFRRAGDSYQPNFYTSPDEKEVFTERIFSSETPTNIDLLSFKVDHERTVLGGKLETGLKFSNVTTDNTFNFYDVNEGVNILDAERSNNFIYDEKVAAAYFNFQRQFEKWGIQAGLRVEQTNSIGTLTSMQAGEDDEVKRSYIDYFPSGGITYQASPKTSWRLNYSRRINRPSYQDLNPFEYKLDELTYQRGNPFLQPQYTQAIQLTNSYNYRYNTTLSYSYTKDYFTQIIDTTETSRSFISQKNLANQQVISLSFGAPITINKWWNVYANVNAYQQLNNADFGDGKIVDVKISAISLYNQHTFMLPKGVSMEISGFYNSPSIWGGTFKTKSMWGVDAGIKMKVLNGRGNVKVSVGDIFNTQNWTGNSDFGGVKIATSGNWESRRLRVNFSYLFGNDKVKSRNRKTGLEDEKNRIKSE